jgi:hypothetical protein
MWLLVAGLFAGICYSMGFNAGCDEGEGRIWRRQMERVQEAAEVQHVADADIELATVSAQTIDADEPTGEQSTGVESYADLLGRSVPPTLAARTSHEEAF